MVSAGFAAIVDIGYKQILRESPLTLFEEVVIFMSRFWPSKALIFLVAIILVCLSLTSNITAQTNSLGVVKGVVRDREGNPVAGAVVSLLRDATGRVLRRARSAVDGSFVARVVPGSYTMTASAEGFSSASLPNVRVSRFTEAVYGINLERIGSGKTFVERRVDRDDPKWRIRASQNSRSIFQNNEGATVKTDETVAEQDLEESPSRRKYPGNTIVETYFSNSSEPNSKGFVGLNFATIQPITNNFDLVISGQTGAGKKTPQRLETTANLRVNKNHKLSFKISGAKLGEVKIGENESEDLGQISFQALDEWRVRDGVILVFGVDYSRFVGAGNDSSISPRLGAQFEVDSKTRINTSFTSTTEERNWQQVADLEDTQVIFRQPITPTIAMEEKEPVMRKSRRLEFGVERVLDNNSNLEATIFFDTTTGRGVGLISLPMNFLNAESSEQVVAQNGNAQGLRVVYSRRLNETFSTSFGYSIGRGQKLSTESINNPSNIFENAIFQTAAAQLAARLGTGTKVNTVFRMTPKNTVMAIDPFAGRLAVLDPSLSVLVTQQLPTLGLPVKAEAIIDARNLLEAQTEVNNGQTSLKLTSANRIVRGGISVRF
jgi:hypothetical protein